MPTPVKAGALMLACLEPSYMVRSFLQGIDKETGTKTEDGWDGIGAFLDHLGKRRAAKKMTGYDNYIDLLGCFLSAYEIWKNEKRVGHVKSTNPLKYHKAIQKKRNGQ